jgi:YD repeat-containing protein
MASEVGPRKGGKVQYRRSVSTQTYDADGNVTSVTDPDGNVTSTVYDADGRATVSINPNGSRTTLTYDADGETTSLSDASAALTFTDDNDGRMTSESTSSPGGQPDVTLTSVGAANTGKERVFKDLTGPLQMERHEDQSG